MSNEYLLALFEANRKALQQTAVELKQKIADVTLDDDDSVSDLQLYTDIFRTAYEVLCDMQPTSAKKAVPYPIETAVTDLAQANLLLARAESILRRRTKTQSTGPPPQTNSVRRNVPEQKIKPFSGNIVEYASFIAAFKLKYDPLPVTDAEKLQYLKDNVSGNPHRAIRSLDLTDANYALVLKKFDEQFNRPDDVVSRLYAQLESLPRSSSETSQITATYFELEGILSALESHGHNLDSFPPLRTKIYKKYPRWLINNLNNTKLLPVKEFQQGVATTISVRTSLDDAEPESKGGTATFHANQRDEKGKRDNKGAGKQTQQSGKGEDRVTCAFCLEKHYSNSCEKYATLEERRALVKDRCYLCLNKNHTISECRRKIRCYYCKKENHHHQALCPQKYGTSEQKKESNVPAKDENKLIAFAKNHRGAHTTALVTLVNPSTRQQFEVRVLFDNGSSESYITERAARRFGLTLGKFIPNTVSVFGTQQPIHARSTTTTFELTNENGFRLPVIADTMPELPQDVRLFDYEEFRQSYPLYADYPLVEQGRALPIDILLGGDYYYDLLEPAEKITITDGLHIFSSAFGNMLVGRKRDRNNTDHNTAYFVMTPTNAVNKICALDAIGIKDTPLTSLQEEEIALRDFYASLKFVDGRYEIRWPWKEFPPPLENNFQLALAVLRAQQKKLSQSTFEAYNSIIAQQISSGIVEKIEVADPRAPGAYYLPHHAVIAPEKSTPIRIVFNGKAKSVNARYSINDTIYKGLNLLENLIGIQIRTLFKVILAIADIEKAFHQLRIDRRDADYVRFLWLKDWQKPPIGINLIILRFLRVAFGIDASPFLLYATIRHHLLKNRTKINAKFIKKLIKAMYADNVAAGFDSQEEAEEFYRFAVEIFQQCGMNLRSWASNSQSLRAKFDQSNDSPSISILGIVWDQYADQYHLAPITIHEKISLRTVLSTVSSLYDPIGWMTPIATTAKLFLRELNDSGYTWDTPLSPQHAAYWLTLREELLITTKITFARFQFDLDDAHARYELHTFSDASALAYTSVTYLRKISETGSTIAMVFARSRIVPRSPKLTIPKLELIAATLATKHIAFVREELPAKIEKTILWSDSKCVLAWVTTNKILPTYVKRLVESIRAIPDVEYRYVPSEKNPADLPSRGGDAASLDAFRLGPTWLNIDADWPQDVECTVSEPELLTPEIKQDKQLVATIVKTVPRYPFDIDPTKYGEYLRLLRVTSYCMKFISKFQYSRRQKIFEDSSPFAAEKLWVGYEQLNHHYDVIEALQQQKKHELVVKLNLYLDTHNLIRCAGRFQFAPLSVNEKRPLYIPSPKLSYFTYLVIRYYHQLTYHSGVTRTLHALRRKFWFTAGRRHVYQSMRHCAKCKRQSARPLPQPTMSDLPDIRLYEPSPFSNIGIDTFGPIYIEQRKYYGLIVADLVIRAIDLELLESLKSEEIVLALRTVFARRRLPEIILSDNAKQFQEIKGAFEKLFTHAWSWKFIPPHAPWMGGAYERLIALIKSALTRTFYNETLNERKLRTAFAEIASIINSRPLTYVNEDIEDDPITPEHFLNVPYASTSPEREASAVDVQQYLKHAAALRDKFWNIWRSTYLQYLRTQYTRYNFPKKVTFYVPKVGDIVILSVNNQKRSKWPLGKILKLYSSKDNIVRSAAIKTKNGIVVRPLMEIYPLEIHTDTDPPATVEPIDEWEDYEIEVQVVDDE